MIPMKEKIVLFDYLIVGAGFAGSVLAERLARDAGKKVLIVDKRPHIGGNAYDHYNDAGILVHKYGPHIFHTNSREVFDYLSMFTEWRSYEHRVLASVDGQLVPIPINLDTINTLYGLRLTSQQVGEFFESMAEKRERARTSEDVIVGKVGRELYEKFFRNYTRKQWDLDPSELDASVTARVPVRTNRDDRYFTDTYQAMPLNGYTRMFEKMLDHDNIKIMLNTDYREVIGAIPYREMIYTGPVDEFFDYRYGKLPYRSLEFKHQTLDTATFQRAPVVNYPNEHAYTRITEFKYLTGQEHPKTSVVYEFPKAEGDPYYPVPRPENAELYKRYRALAETTPGVHFVGRLATYRYYNMDQVVAQALATYAKLAGLRRHEGKNGNHNPAEHYALNGSNNGTALNGANLSPVIANGAHESNGVNGNGHGTNGHASNGHGSNGHGANGHGANGHGTNGIGTNGHGANGHSANGIGGNGSHAKPS
jgi:UDP-galactopyranose mutase